MLLPPKKTYQLVFNWHQTGTKLVPASDWTMAEEGSKQVEVCGVKLVPASDWTMTEEGSKQVEVRGLDDKREITA